MSLHSFFDHFDLLAEAPGGVKKLRELILQLAVQGKLVPQDPSDEPASALLERIKLNKGSDKYQKKMNISDIQEDSQSPFNLPINWSWVRANGFLEVIRGVTYNKQDAIQENRSGYLPLLRANNIDVELNFSNLVYVPENLVSQKQFIYSGDILIAMSSGSKKLVGKAAQAKSDFQGGFGAFCGLIRINPIVNKQYIAVFFHSPLYRTAISAVSKGIGINNLQKGNIENLLIPLPPLAEQRRIVAKVDALMGLCDELEARQERRRAGRVQLSATALDRLLAARDPEELAASWLLVADSFDLLYDTPETIGRLRQAILQLAVQGRLVSQDPADEPASVLLERIRAEKERSKGTSSTQHLNLLQNSQKNLVDNLLPEGWIVVELTEISDVGTGSTPLKTQLEFYEEGTIPWVTSAATSKDVITQAETLITPKAVKDCRLKLYPSGTLIIAMYGQGKTRGQIAELGIPATINQACAAISLYYDSNDMRPYIRMVIEKKYDEIRSMAAGAAQPNLNVGKIKETLIPLPPLAEQRRIVAKVDALMGLCDELEARLRQAHADGARLLGALAGAVAGG
ncbi:MAG: restriction endonuclease subunit S [Herpetosiphonaceae bacterium]|nr:restriction endonuclease subunit S [Herpetosiphonaceae bacterium]